MKGRTCMMIIVVLTLLPLAALAGQTDSPGDPTTTAGHMPTLQELYQYLTSGTEPSAPGAFEEPSAGPGATMKTLKEIYEDFKALIELCTVAPEQVLQGQTFFQTIGTWGPAAGTMPDHGAVTITPGTSAQPIDAGYHNGSGSVEGDADLVAGNIADGVEIFGVTGTGTMTVGPPAPVEKTGQTKCYDLSGTEISCTGTGQDGDHQAGVTWPNPRFTDNSDGTVTDNLTGLIWLKKANCGGSRNWSNALTFVNALYDGWTGDGSGGDCGLSDNSSAGDWRLPNVKELQSLIDYGRYNPALPGDHPFSGVQSSVYWSSATNEYYPSRAWIVNLHHGSLSLYAKSDDLYVWPVRGGQ